MLVSHPLFRRFAYAVATFFLIFCTPAAAETYPDPDEVAADNPDPAKRVATFYVLTKVINNHGYSQQAANQYMAAQGKYDPPFPFEQHQALVKQWEPLANDPAFVSGVVHRYLPFLAARVDGELGEQKQGKLHERLMEKTRVVGEVLIATVIAVPLLFLVWRPRGRTHAPKIAEVAGPLRFPDDLRRAHVFRKSYPLAFECGQIYDINEWTETTSSTSTTPGRTYTIGDTIYHEAGTTTTTYHSTKWHQYWINRPDKKQNWIKFADRAFVASKNQIVSIIDSEGYILYAYNHSTGNLVRHSVTWGTPHRYPGRWAWGATVLAAGAVTYLSRGYLVSDYRSEMPMEAGWMTSVGMAMIVCGIVAGIYVFILKLVVENIRHWHFRLKYEKRFRAFFESCTGPLRAMYPGPALPRP